MRLVFLCRALTEDWPWARNVKGTFFRLTITLSIPMLSAVVNLGISPNSTPGYSDLIRPRRTLYQELVEGVVSGPLWAARLTGGRVDLFLVLGASCELPQQHRIFAYLAIDPERSLSMTWLSERTEQICPIITGMIVVSMKPIPSSTVPMSSRFGIISAS